MCSSQIDDHLANMVKHAASVLPSLCFLYSETAGCVYHAYNPEECLIISTANYTISLFLTALFIYQALFSFQKSGGVWSMERIASFRELR